MIRLLVLSLAFGTCCACLLAQQPVCTDCASLKPVNAAAAWNLLVAGNEQFRADCGVTRPCPSAPRRGKCRRVCTATAQSPFAIVLSCADSRVPPELLFDQGIGDLFIIRIAGNLATTEAKGSIEYALIKFDPKPKLLLVLGHADCGAARSAIHYQPPAVWEGSLELFSIFAPIFRAVENCKDYEGNSCISDVVIRNVQRVVADLNAFKPVQDAKLSVSGFGVGGAFYDLASGEVRVVQYP